VEWMQLAQDTDQWRDLVNTVMNLQVHKRRIISWLAKWLLASQGLCSMELNGFIWLRIGICNWIMLTQQWTFGFHKRRIISLLVEWLLASHEGLCSMELVNWIHVDQDRDLWWDYVNTVMNLRVP
jgi:hypothetical protein